MESLISDQMYQPDPESILFHGMQLLVIKLGVTLAGGQKLGVTDTGI